MEALGMTVLFIIIASDLGVLLATPPVMPKNVITTAE